MTDRKQKKQIEQWGSATAKLVQPYIDALSDEARLELSNRLANGQASIRIDGSIFPTRLRIMVKYHDQPETVVLGEILGGDAASAAQSGATIN